MRINLRSQSPISNEIMQACNGDRIVAGILCGRGFDTPEKIKGFFLDGYVPVSAADLKDIDKIINRISQAIDNKEKICVYGDYDVDGVTSTAILTECLNQLGANNFYHVPDRFSEGYGMNTEVIREISKKGVRLIITCDCGIANNEEIELANSLGMEVVVTDHHSIPEKLPPAFGILNPKIWGEEHPAYCVSGAVTAFYLARALLCKYGEDEFAKEFYDLIALSIVADVVPLTSENRYLLKEGLKAFPVTRRLGLKYLMEIAKANGEIDEEFIGFQIAPRLNAAGRLDSARKAVELLMTDDKAEASRLAQELDSLNQARKKIEGEIVEKAEQMIISGHKDRNIFALYDEFWHHGVIGIAAGRLCEKYKKPVILMTLKEDGKTAVGSARSPEGVSIYEILSECNPEKLSFGGHDAAAGLSLNIKDVSAFIKEVERVSLRHNAETEKTIDVDLELKLSEINESLWDSIKSIAPYGQGFERPVFLSGRVKVNSNLPIKNIGRRLVLQNGPDLCSGVLWRQADYEEMPEDCEIIYNVSQTVFRDKKEVRLNVINILEKPENGKSEYEPQEVKIIDIRGVPEKVEEYCGEKDTVIFYEGIDKKWREKGTSRFDIPEVHTLVLYSIPPSIDIFKRLIKKARPKEVIISFADEIITKDELIRRTVGIIKHIISKKQGITSYSELESLLGQTFETTALLLNCFQASGFMEYNEVEDNLFLKEGKFKVLIKNEKYKKAISTLFAESAGFKSFIKKADIESLKGIFITI